MFRTIIINFLVCGLLAVSSAFEVATSARKNSCYPLSPSIGGGFIPVPKAAIAKTLSTSPPGVQQQQLKLQVDGLSQEELKNIVMELNLPNTKFSTIEEARGIVWDRVALMSSGDCCANFPFCECPKM